MSNDSPHEFASALVEVLGEHLDKQAPSSSGVRNLSWAVGLIAGVYLLILGQLTAWAVQTEQTRYRAADANAAHEQLDRVWEAKFASVDTSIAHLTGLLIEVKTDVKDIKDRLRETEKHHAAVR